MDKTEQLIRLLKEKESKNSFYIKIVVTLILIFELVIGHIICVNIILSERKTDYRYFNLTRSLEEVHHIYIDTYDGTVYKTKEEVINAQKRRQEEIKPKKSFFKKYIKFVFD